MSCSTACRSVSPAAVAAGEAGSSEAGMRIGALLEQIMLQLGARASPCRKVKHGESRRDVMCTRYLAMEAKLLHILATVIAP